MDDCSLKKSVQSIHCNYLFRCITIAFACKHISTQHVHESGRCRNDLLSNPRIGESRQSLNRLYPCNLGGIKNGEAW